MAKLRASGPPDGLPVSVGAVTLASEDLGRVTSVSPFRGQLDAVRDAIGGWPDPGRWLAVNGGRLVWSGQGQALAMGLAMTGDAAALTDQSDAFASFRLSGAGAEATLARLCPLDMRARNFPVGSVARTLLGQSTALILRDEQGFLLMVPRSMGGSAKRTVERAMQDATRA